MNCMNLKKPVWTQLFVLPNNALAKEKGGDISIRLPYYFVF
jgi:hypothetical protein